MNPSFRRRQAPLLTLPGLLALPILGVLAPVASVEPLAPTAMAAPEPAPIPRRWQLDVEVSPLRMIVLDAPGVGARPYYFLTYKVTNNTAQDILFAPAFELATDGMDVHRSGRDVPVAVTNALIEKIQNPFLEDQISIVGTLLRGEENAKEGLVIWPVPSLHQSEVVVYAAGFSGETATVEIPVVKTDENGNKVEATEKKVLRKTLMLRYRMPGDLAPGFDEPMEPSQQQWIMR